MHHLIDMSTNVFIESMERQLDILKNPALPGHTYAISKDAKGISVSVDNLDQIPPDMVEEYNVPALEKIAARFDGVTVHSCGNWMHNVDAILRIKGIKGLNFHSSPVDMDPEIVLKKIKKSGKDVTILTDFGKVGINWTKDYKDEKEAYFKWYLKKILHNGLPRGVFITTYGNYVTFGNYVDPYPHEFGDDITRTERMNKDYDWIKSKIREILQEGKH